jgi:hypothetical protein
VSLFTGSVDDGEFVRHVGVGGFQNTRDIVASESAFYELGVVADTGNSGKHAGHWHAVVFSAGSMGVGLLSVVAADDGDFMGVAVHSGSLYSSWRDCAVQCCGTMSESGHWQSLSAFEE